MNKLATPKYIKLLRAGKLSQKAVSGVAKELHLSPREIKLIGSGNESMAHLVTHPEAGLAVQKSFNFKNGILTPKGFQKKVEVMQALNDNPSFAKLLGTKENRGVLYQEYVDAVKNAAGNLSNKELKQRKQAVKAGISAAKKSVAHLYPDVKMSDMIYTGGNILHDGLRDKVVDFLPRSTKDLGFKHQGVYTSNFGHPYNFLARGKNMLDNFKEMRSLVKVDPGSIMRRAHTEPLVKKSSINIINSEKPMNKLAAAVKILQENEGSNPAEVLTMYKQASAAQALGEVYPRIADKIVSSFYKQASEQASSPEDVIYNTAKFARAMTKIAGSNFEDKEDVIMKLATVAILEKSAAVNSEENNLACYHLIQNLVG